MLRLRICELNLGTLDTLVKRGRDGPVTEPRKQSINFGAKNREAGGHKRSLSYNLYVVY